RLSAATGGAGDRLVALLHVGGAGGDVGVGGVVEPPRGVLPWLGLPLPQPAEHLLPDHRPGLRHQHPGEDQRVVELLRAAVGVDDGDVGADRVLLTQAGLDTGLHGVGFDQHEPAFVVGPLDADGACGLVEHAPSPSPSLALVLAHPLWVRSFCFLAAARAVSSSVHWSACCNQSWWSWSTLVACATRSASGT